MDFVSTRVEKEFPKGLTLQHEDQGVMGSHPQNRNSFLLLVR